MRGTIAAGHPLTAEAGQFALREGGNAIDAALAAAVTSWVVEPVLASPGGGAFALVAHPGDEPRILDGFAHTPRRRATDSRQFLVHADFGPEQQGFYLGPGTVASPGTVALLAALHDQGARLPWRALFAPAIDHARRGITITRHSAQLFQVVRDLYLTTPETRARYGRPEDATTPLAEGDHWVQAELADFLEALADGGARFFYHGEIGELIAHHLAAHGGHLRRDDFEQYRAIERKPLAYRIGRDAIWSNPLPSLGARYGQLGLMALESGRAHLAGAGEDAYLSDLFALQGTLNEAWQHLGESAPVPSPADPWWDERLPRNRSVRGTTHLSAVDEDGRLIALTASNGAGSAVLVPGTGFMLNNMLGETDLVADPEAVNAWEPDRRMASMMAPTLLERADGARLATGSGGSMRIRTTLLQILLHLVREGASLREAVLAPRLHVDGLTVHLESGFSASQLEHLRSHSGDARLVEHPPENLFFGGAHSVERSAAGGLEGSGDPRRGGVSRSV